MTQSYIGTKQVTAWVEEKDGKSGYAVKYADGYISWSPKDVFEAAYLPMGEKNDGSKITQEMVDGFVLRTTASKMGEKNTVVCAVLRNGFEIVESSSCVDVKNFSMDIGVKICMERIKNKVWHLLGFMLQQARSGLVVPSDEAVDSCQK